MSEEAQRIETVRVDGYCDIESFEKALKSSYNSSLKLRKVTVVFDLTLLIWIDLFQLGLLSLWIAELYGNGNKVIIKLPRNIQSRSFLLNLGFVDCVSNIALHNIDGRDQYRLLPSEKTPYLPIQFIDRNSYDTLISDIEDNDRLRRRFDDIGATEVVKDGHIRDVILKELGENLFIHGNGRIGLLAATKIETEKATLNRKSPFEREFFLYNHDRAYVTVIFCDKGPGFKKSLKQAYENDKLLTRKPVNPTDADLIKYAFLEHSTSRTLEERISYFEAGLLEDFKNFEPSTGLFNLYELVKSFRGLILVRSGSCIVSYNFSTSNPSGVHINASDDIKGYRNLSNFGGVQIKILLPVEKLGKSVIAKRTKFRFPELQNSIKYTYISSEDYFKKSAKPEERAKQLLTFVSAIDQFNLQNSQSRKGIIYDVGGSSHLDYKIEYLAIVKLIKSQSIYSNYHCIINLDVGKFEIINNSIRGKVDAIRPIIVFDKDFNRKVLGLNENDSSFFQDILKQSEKAIDDLQIPSVIKYLFEYDNSKGTISLIHNRVEILREVSGAYATRISSIILDVNNRILWNNVKVLIPTEKYLNKYF